MSWIQKLCETYANAARTDASAPGAINPLPAPGFVAGEMPLTVTLSADGHFLDAERTPEGMLVLIPCTLESGVARQHPVKPHPLFDSVKYLGTDEQMKILSDWCQAGAPDAVRAVRTYLRQGTLKEDLDRNLTKKKVEWKDGDGVKFCVATALISEPAELWLSETVLNSWKKYFTEHYLPTVSKELCYTLGKTLPVAKKHPYAYGTLLLIAMNGNNCVGRFMGSAQSALAVSVEATMKAHNTLKWLIRRQGRYLDRNTVLIAWGTGAEELPNLTDFDPEDEFDERIDDIAPTAKTWYQLGKAAGDGSQGFESRLLRDIVEKNREASSTAVIMVIDSTSGNGRASVTYYQELNIFEYLGNLIYWYDTCKWSLRRWRNGQSTKRPRTPLPREIAALIYGANDGEGEKKLKRQLIKRLIPCITARRPIPHDIVAAAFNKSINPAGFISDGAWDKNGWEKAVDITCALIRKYFEKEGHPMALDENNNERNYLFGRLLAVADVAERDGMSRSEAAWRQTNAVRYIQRFQQRPQSTWLKLYSNYLPPYLNRLKEKSVRYTRLIDDITNRFQPGDMADQRPLDGRFLEGYSCQKTALFRKSEKNKSITINEEDDGNDSSEK